MVDNRIEDDDAQRVRVQINRIMDEVHDIVLRSGIRPSIRWTPPPAVGGYAHDIDLIRNIFQIHRFQISPNNVFDFVDRAIGIYENNDLRALLRTFNPLFYLGLALDWVAALPFILIGRIGYSRTNAESSVLGRLAKGFLYLVSAVFATTASVLTVLHLLDYLEPVKRFVRQVIGSS